MANVDVRAEVARLRRDLQVKLEISSERVLTELSKLAFFDVRRVFNEDGTLKAINELDGETAASIAGLEHEKLFEHFQSGQAKHVGTNVKVKFANKLQALETLGRWHKLRLWQENVNVSGLRD